MTPAELNKMVTAEQVRGTHQRLQSEKYDQMEFQMANDQDEMARQEMKLRSNMEVDNWKKDVVEAQRKVQEADARVVEATAKALDADALYKEEVIKRQNAELSLSELQMVITEMQTRSNEEAANRIAEWEEMQKERLRLEQEIASQSEMQLRLVESQEEGVGKAAEIQALDAENDELQGQLEVQGELVEYLKRGYMRVLLEVWAHAVHVMLQPC
jgi:hypothetical protein